MGPIKSLDMSKHTIKLQKAEKQKIYINTVLEFEVTEENRENHDKDLFIRLTLPSRKSLEPLHVYSART